MYEDSTTHTTSKIITIRTTKKNTKPIPTLTSSNSVPSVGHGLLNEVKERVEYGRRGDDGDRYPPLPSRRRGEVERIRAMYGRRPIGWSPLFVHVLTAYHQEVQ